MAEQREQWQFQSGPYLGEISALAFLPLAPHVSPSPPLLLAGTGSQLLVYDVDSGELLGSFHAFQGVRVHGISPCSLDSANLLASPSAIGYEIAVYGERRVKLFRLQVDCQDGVRGVGLDLVCRLPRFDHWVLDALFLKGDGYLVLGLSDNSVAVWDVARSSLFLRVKSPERCLLYSMRMRGDNIESLRVASGTIYNEILVWKLIPQSHFVAKGSLNPVSSSANPIQKPDEQYTTIQLSRLSGHEGSIFRLAWSPDGLKLMSVSDDRSARIWTATAQRDCGDPWKILDVHASVNLTLFGHNARIWDCYLSDSIVITAGEDCTCRVWGMDSNQLMLIKEHVGRGIWRCLYDPIASLLITAGFDSAIKVHPLHPSSFRDRKQNDRFKESDERMELFSICTPNVSEEHGLVDSKSEYVRCLRFRKEDILYVATNNGYLYHIELSNPKDVRWTQLARVCDEVPIICMDLMSMNLSNAEDMIAIGDGKGNATVVGVGSGACSPNATFSFTWAAEAERQLLGIYWFRLFGHRHLFTADPRGTLKLWRTLDASELVTDGTIMDPEVSLVAVFSSCFRTRIMSLDASLKEELVVCGDQRGNLIIFSLSNTLIVDDSSKSIKKLPSLTHFKGAHGISSVTSVFIDPLNSNQIEIRTTGGDGCICYFKYQKNWQRVEFTGMKQVKELSISQSVIDDSSSAQDLAQGNYAIGFASADFIVWNLMNDVKVLQVPCGGWRRPYSYYFGDVPEFQNCFAFLKDHTIHLHRLWVPVSERRSFPHVLHLQFHGREIHSLCFISFELTSNPYKDSNLLIATGCEDGTVRLTRYTRFGSESWTGSKMLGEHVSGSAVRSICFISTIYTSLAGQTSMPYPSSDNGDNCCLLISVGAKQVLTSWLLRNRCLINEKERSINGILAKDTSTSSSNDCLSVSFQWLSTHVPPKFVSTRGEAKFFMKGTESTDSSAMKYAPNSASRLAGSRRPESKLFMMDNNENDWRYLAVTAFLVKNAVCGFTVCFIVVACSDATLTLRALLLPYRLWFDVALLVLQTSPVLALQHFVVPLNAQANYNSRIGTAYIIIGGSTDGNITFWDLTERVECFMQFVSDIQPENLIDCQRRPCTGRGSQGGRWWKSVTNQSLEKGIEDSLRSIDGDIDIEGPSANESGALPVPGNEPKSSNPNSFSTPRMRSSIFSNGRCEVKPFRVMTSVHQSGVNCLHVSELQGSRDLNSELTYCVLSGGDDQALHCLVFDLTPIYMQHIDNENHMQDASFCQPPGSSCTGESSHCSLFNKYKFRVLHGDRIASAHSSAVKGIWTDGIWVFSTGLDQRIRCWRIDNGKTLIEHSNLIISVPEPETLDAISCDSAKNQYQVAVAGRGMQIVKFSASCAED